MRHEACQIIYTRKMWDWVPLAVALRPISMDGGPAMLLEDKARELVYSCPTSTNRGMYSDQPYFSDVYHCLSTLTRFSYYTPLSCELTFLPIFDSEALSSYYLIVTVNLFSICSFRNELIPMHTLFPPSIVRLASKLAMGSPMACQQYQ